MKSAELFLGNAGTAVRPLTAALAFSGGRYRLAGVPRMHERPIGDLVDALRGLGADIRYLGKRRLPAARDRARRRLGERRRECACAATCRASTSPRCSWRCRWPAAARIAIDGRSGLQALRRDDAQPDGALRRARRARRLAARSTVAAGVGTLAGRDPRRGRRLVGLVLSRRRRDQRRAGARGGRRPRAASRATCGSPRCSRAWAPRRARARLDRGGRPGAALDGDRRGPAITSPMPP